MSCFKTCLWNLPQAERDSLYKAGTISAFSTQEPYGRVWRYGVPIETAWQDRVQYYPRTPHRQVPVLDISEFAENGSNLNHWTYLEIAKAQWDDDLWALRNRPDIFVNTFMSNVGHSFMPGSRWFFYEGHLGRRRANADILSKYYWWMNTNEWSAQ